MTNSVSHSIIFYERSLKMRKITKCEDYCETSKKLNNNKENMSLALNLRSYGQNETLISSIRNIIKVYPTNIHLK